VTGAKFKLVKGPNDVHEYAIIATDYSITSNRFASGDGQGDYEVSAAVEATDAKTVFRPPRVSPKPLIQGSQTAIVVGRHGEEIDADKWGRVKVQFHWDREGQKDENSSCWVRVAQVWAGKNWGAMHIPRVGQEVLVDFLEGDPDRPIITGRVYNNDMMPPYALPENVTQSGIKSRSSKQGGDDDYNEIRFEDKKGSEQLLVHAQKDMLTEVEHDKTLTVGHDSTTKIKHDSVTEIENDRKLTITHDETCTIKNDHSTTIQGKEKRDVTGKRTTTISDDDALTVKANAKSDIDQNYSLKAGQQITLETGASRLVMKSDGTIQLEGVQLTIKGSVKIEVSTLQFKLEGTMVQLQGTNTQVQATMLQLQGSALAALKGAITMIG
jgi:type VI secretion system secreted protein VgrG